MIFVRDRHLLVAEVRQAVVSRRSLSIAPFPAETGVCFGRDGLRGGTSAH